MNKSQIFKLAHAFAKKVKQSGDSYSVCFAAALKEIYALINKADSMKGWKSSSAENGSLYIEVLQSDADALIGQEIEVYSNLNHGAKVSPRARRSKSVEARLDLHYRRFAIDSKGMGFERDGKGFVRLYGNAEMISESI